ncbi:MAG: enoyl-CoA hydratase/isomerase family protein [Polyangiaceae bacterium]|nr:enoyl-CoA hydratase/isomerase family protein [Polyangiaceae bacterium]
MSEPLVTVERHGPAASLILNRPDKRNAINQAVLDDLARAVATVRDDPAVRVLILRGRGPVFSSGIDHNLLLEVFQKSQTAPFRHLHGDLHVCVNALAHMEKPVVAVLHGAAVGMALELALAADFRLARADCVVGLPEVAFGILPDVGGTTRLTRLIGTSRAKEMILTGELFTADRAESIGLVNRALATEEALEAAVTSLVAALARHPPAAVGLGKSLIDRVQDVDLATALRLEGVYQSILLQRPDVGENFAPALGFIQSELKRARGSK